MIRLREVRAADLPVLFDQQLDPEACEMATFPARDRAAFDAHWARLLENPSIVTRTIEVDGDVAGHLGSFEVDGEREVSYWLGRELWGRGIATTALELMLAEVVIRPLFATVAEHNLASLRVLEKCGFQRLGTSVADDGVTEIRLILDS